MKLALFTLAVLFLSSCGSDTGKKSTAVNEKPVAVSKQDSSAQPAVSKDDEYEGFFKKELFKKRIILSNITTHFFSDSVKKDTFKLVLTGDSIDNAAAIFSIISHEGKTIYADTFYSTELYFSEENNMTKGEQIKGITQRVKGFFIDSSFSMPASCPNSGSDVEDPKITGEIKADKTAIGFNYNYGEENNVYIAYSKKRHKVVVYWNCC